MLVLIQIRRKDSRFSNIFYSSENTFCEIFSIGSILYSPSTTRLLYSYLIFNDLNTLLNKLNFLPSSVNSILVQTSNRWSRRQFIFLYAVVWGTLHSFMISLTDLSLNIVQSKIFTMSVSAKAVRMACFSRWLLKFIYVYLFFNIFHYRFLVFILLTL